jgi:hypothetical protein
VERTLAFGWTLNPDIPRMDGIVSRAESGVKGLDRVSGGFAALDTAFGSAMLCLSGECHSVATNFRALDHHEKSFSSFCF